MRDRRRHDRRGPARGDLAADVGSDARLGNSPRRTDAPSSPPAASCASGQADERPVAPPRVLDGEQRHRATATHPRVLPRDRHRPLLPPGPELHARRAQPRRHPSHDRPDDLRRGMDRNRASVGEHHRAGEGGEHGRLRRHRLARGLRVRPLRATRARRRDERSPQPLARARRIAEPQGHGRERAAPEGVRRADNPVNHAGRLRRRTVMRATRLHCRCAQPYPRPWHATREPRPRATSRRRREEAEA
jgi:hypothetical protein